MTNPLPDHTSAKALDALTGLRFFAAYAVLFHHVHNRLHVHPEIRLPYGEGAVSFFYVLSGFILAHVYAGKISSAGDVWQFWIRRWARIWPLHIVCLLIWMSLWWPPRNFGTLLYNSWPKALANVFLVQSWIPDYRWSFWGNGVSWSISDEMFFYFAFPFLMLMPIKWFRWMLPLWAGIMVALCFQWHRFLDTDSVTPFFHQFPLVRIGEFMLGISVRLFLYRRGSPIQPMSFSASLLSECAVIGLFLAVWQYVLGYDLMNAYGRMGMNEATKILLRFTGYAPVFASVIYVFSRSTGPLARFCARPTVVYLGEISFSLYMVHQHVITYILTMFYAGGNPSRNTILIAVSIAAILVSCVLYHLIEMPMRSALVHLVSGNFRKAWESYAGFKIPGHVAALITVLLVANAVQFRTMYFDKQTMDRTLLASVPEVLATYGGSVDINAVAVKPSRNGSQILTIKMNRRENIPDANLFIQLCNENAKFLRSHPVETVIDDPLGQITITEVLEASELESVKFVSLGFFFREQKRPVPVTITAKEYLKYSRNRFLIPIEP